jgi:ABC-type nitrate/sulfonate/bicarbonate transport system substrate-binding protein
VLVVVLALVLVVGLLGACTSSPPTIGTVARTTPGGGSAEDTTPADMTVTAGKPFPAARCAENKAAGTITFLTGFDYAAAASMVDVFVAHSKGYYTALCLDVQIKPSFSGDNYPLIAADNAQFASGGSFGELVEYAGRNEAQFKALAVEGRSDIDVLIVKPSVSKSLDDLRGKTLGIKTALLPGVKAMLLQQGLVEGKDYDTVQIEGFDPKVHIATPDIVGFDGYTSNEPLQLQSAKIQFDSYRPSDYGIPGSFGVIYSNATFISEHPTAAEDFMRATMRALRDAIADPIMAAGEAVKLLSANGNPMGLSPDSEVDRWQFESKLVAASATSAFPLGVPDPVLLEKEVVSYGEIGVFGGITPDYSQTVDLTMLQSLYDSSSTIIWPAPTG